MKSLILPQKFTLKKDCMFSVNTSDCSILIQLAKTVCFFSSEINAQFSLFCTIYIVGTCDKSAMFVSIVSEVLMGADVTSDL